MSLAGFVGPAYKSQALVADGEASINLYPERIESGQGKAGAQFVLYSKPGLSFPIANLPDHPNRGLWANEASLWAVSGGTLYEVLGGPIAPTVAGSVNIASSPAQIIPNGNQLLVVSGGQGYVVNNGPLSVTPIIAASTGTFIDGYFVVSQPFSNQFNISNLNNGNIWDPLEFGVKQGYPDHLAAVFAAFEQLWLFGTDTTEVWYDSGALNFPFQRIPGGLIEYGCYAPYSVALVENTLMWLGGASFSGHGVVYQAQGLIPTRVSNHALEYLIQNVYGNIQDAVAYSYQDSGHSFYVLSFPSADATWVYDLTTGEWHQRGSWDEQQGIYHADLARFHAFTNNAHYVGDYNNGNIYMMHQDIYTDNGAPIRRLRSSPHITDNMLWTKYNSFMVDMQVGVDPDGTGVTNPQAMMQWSDDGGLTWSNEKWTSIGPQGQYFTRVIWRRCQRSRNRCFRVVITEPIQVAMVNAYLNITNGAGV